MRRLVDREMKGLVEFDRARQIGRRRLALRPHRLFRARDRTQVAVVAMQRRLRRRMALDGDAHLGQVAKLRRRHQRHAHRAVRRHLQRLVGDQPRHRLAHRHDGDAEHVGRRAQRQFFARRQPAGNQQIGQLRVGALTQRLTVERLHQIERGGQIQRGISMRPEIFAEGTRQRPGLLQL